VDCCFSTLKDRLGLPDHILKTLPTEADVVSTAYGFEKSHPELFHAKQIAQVGVYFSYETRKHSFFGNLSKGYYKDYSATLKLLFRAGIGADTVFSFPKDAARYPVVFLSSAAKMTMEEESEMKRYLEAGGKVIVTGPCAFKGCIAEYDLPNRPDLSDPLLFFSTIANGVWHRPAAWITETQIPPSQTEDRWLTPRKCVFYHPYRISEGRIDQACLSLCRRFLKPMPVKVIGTKGYLITAFENDESVLLHFLAEDYDTDIDHRLDEMRFHRSRVNYVNRVTPIGVSETVTLEAEKVPEIYLPFDKGEGVAVQNGKKISVQLPKNTAYFILRFPK